MTPFTFWIKNYLAQCKEYELKQAEGMRLVLIRKCKGSEWGDVRWPVIMGDAALDITLNHVAGIMRIVARRAE